MKKTLLAVLVSSAFGMIGSAQAANYYSYLQKSIL